MQRTSFAEMTCSIARTLDVIGEPWSPLILRDVYVGFSRFDQIQRDLGISSKVLSERLKGLVDNGVLERREYSRRPPRYEYALTEKGRELCDLLLVMVRWGDRWTAGEAGPPVLYRHHACGRISHVELRCSECGEPMRATDIDVLPGPGMTVAGAEAAGAEAAGDDGPDSHDPGRSPTI
ncbi:winged helix-turn-helix transcriptional regulator [Spongiactinospora sp. 9N601]|uniref:winged helix-turn-helix transcriptional regulator n=1 Tax=Spongiactinospora sp. 9N601 TaxID=3375149 RepID=UPI00378A7C8F